MSHFHKIPFDDLRPIDGITDDGYHHSVTAGSQTTAGLSPYQRRWRAFVALIATPAICIDSRRICAERKVFATVFSGLQFQ